MNKLITVVLLFGCCFCYGDRRRAQYGQATAAGGSTTPDILWWPLNDGAGTAINASVGPDGTTDATLNSDYISFNGTDDDAQSDSAITYGTPVITIMAWVYAADWTAGSENVIWENGPNYGSGPVRFILNFNSSQVNAMLYQSGGGRQENFSTAMFLANNTWYHFAVVYDNDANAGAGEIKVYVDGTAVMTTLINGKSGTGNIATETLNLGARNAAGSWYAGRLDDLRIYSGEKDEAFIDAIVAGGRP